MVTRMTTSISSEAHKTIDGQTDKISFRAYVNDIHDRKSLNLIYYVFCSVTDRPMDNASCIFAIKALVYTIALRTNGQTDRPGEFKSVLILSKSVPRVDNVPILQFTLWYDNI